MGNLNVKISNLGLNGRLSRNFEANPKPLETTTLGLNLSKDNDYNVPLRFGSGGPTVFLRPNQVDAMIVALNARKQGDMMGEISGETGSVSVKINGQTHTMSAGEAISQLKSQGVLTKTS
jgi:hypothetical protein